MSRFLAAVCICSYGHLKYLQYKMLRLMAVMATDLISCEASPKPLFSCILEVGNEVCSILWLLQPSKNHLCACMSSSMPLSEAVKHSTNNLQRICKVIRFLQYCSCHLWTQRKVAGSHRTSSLGNRSFDLALDLTLTWNVFLGIQ